MTIVIQDETGMRTIYENQEGTWVKYYEDLDLNRSQKTIANEKELLYKLIQVLIWFAQGEKIDLAYVERKNLIFVNILEKIEQQTPISIDNLEKYI